jgi:hypothetical protein
MMIPAADLDTLEAVKRLIMIKKKPNRYVHNQYGN